ncbi:MAG: hypothetical protein JXB24_02575 [Bacteroidales bacterium]|nr:hypothetical protein [Bacteroidales bacterium]
MKKLMNVFQKPILVALIAILILTLSPIVVSAKTVEPEFQDYYTETFVVTNEGGSYDIGFTTVKFKKNCLSDGLIEILTVEIYAEDGAVYIEFTPDIDYFAKDVQIHASAWSGFLLDRATGELVYFELPNQVFKVSHFSRYCFVF